MHAQKECPRCGRTDPRKDGFYRHKGRSLQQYECRGCGKKFNDATESVFAGLAFPREAVLLAVMLQTEMGLSGLQASRVLKHLWGFAPNPRTAQRWVARFAPRLVALQQALRPRFGDVWMVDEMFLNRHAHASARKPDPKYLITVLDEHRQVVACLVSDTRDAEAVKRVLRLAIQRAGKAPKVISRDGCAIYDAAKRQMWMELKGATWVNAHFKTVAVPFTERQRVQTARHGPITVLRKRVRAVSQNGIERYHCGPRQRENAMRGVKTAASGTTYFEAYGVAHTLFRPHARHGGLSPAQGVGWAPKDLAWRTLLAIL